MRSGSRSTSVQETGEGAEKLTIAATDIPRRMDEKMGWSQIDQDTY